MSVLSTVGYRMASACAFSHGMLTHSQCSLTHARTHTLVGCSFVRPFSPRVRTYVAARAQRSLGRAAGKFGRFRGRFCYGTTGVKEPDGESKITLRQCVNACTPAEQC